MSEPASDDHQQPDDADPSAAPAEIRVVDKRWWARDDTEAAGDERRSDKPAYVEDLERQLADKDALLAEYAGRYKAAARDFEQTRDRLRRELAKEVERETRGVLGAFLEVVDNLDRAIEAGRETLADAADAALLKGVVLVRDQFVTTLGRHGVTRIEAGDEPFDPNVHDALSTVPVTDPARDNVVVAVVKPGYRVGDEVLRPASVTVGKLEGERQG